MARLLEAIPEDSAAGLRLRALVLAYLLTGRRRSEVLNLRWRDLDLEGGFYRYTGKGGKERQRALPPPVQGAILAYAQAAGLARKPEEAVFPSRWRDQPVDGKYIDEQLRQTAELAGIQLERPLHTLRHSYARALRRVEAPLKAVQLALDHSNLATTSIYLRQLEGQEDPWWPKLAAELGLEGGERQTRLQKRGMTATEAVPNLAEELRRRRTALGWTLEQVAEQAQVSVGMLSLIETGKRRPSLRSWDRIRQTLGIAALLPEEGGAGPWF